LGGGEGLISFDPFGRRTLRARRDRIKLLLSEPRSRGRGRKKRGGEKGKDLRRLAFSSSQVEDRGRGEVEVQRAPKQGSKQAKMTGETQGERNFLKG